MQNISKAMAEINSDFVVGDMVVIKNVWRPKINGLYEVERISGDTIEISPYRPRLSKAQQRILGFCISAKHIRHAALREVYARKRLDDMEFAPGDLVVRLFGDDNSLFTVKDFRFQSVLIESPQGAAFYVHKSGLRHILPAENEKKRRLPKAVSDLGRDTYIENHISPFGGGVIHG